MTRHPRLQQPALSPHTFKKVVLPIGVCTALDIGFSNWSLVFISVGPRRPRTRPTTGPPSPTRTLTPGPRPQPSPLSLTLPSPQSSPLTTNPTPHPKQVAFHTIIKGSIPLFVLLCGWVLGLEPCRLLTFTSILLVCAGIGLACSAEVTF